MTNTKGTKEWAKRNLNIGQGCPNNCTYCYAKRMAKRFKRIENDAEWSVWKPKRKNLDKGYKFVGKATPPGLYDYMYPTSHDIFPENLLQTYRLLCKVLRAGNNVLITTKPRFECIEHLCDQLPGYEYDVCFRFTITSRFNEQLEKYEPGAPGFQERAKSLRYAFEHNFRTSISIEPLLDRSPLPIIETLEKWVNDTIWIGAMSGNVPKELQKIYTQENLEEIYYECRDLWPRMREKIRFKDSIVNKLGLEGNQID